MREISYFYPVDDGRQVVKGECVFSVDGAELGNVGEFTNVSVSIYISRERMEYSLFAYAEDNGEGQSIRLFSSGDANLIASSILNGSRPLCKVLASFFLEKCRKARPL